MGVRAHQRIVSTIEYDNSSSFNWGQTAIANLLIPYCNNSIIKNEFGNVFDTFELSVTDIQNVIKELEKKQQDEYVYKDYTIKDVVKVLKHWLDTQDCNKENIAFDDFIYIDWF